ncbi:MAG: heavy metal-responsive transcriptional regulator [Candidatus Zixiibacteriota bacterium]|nr:MAG: heavy metal-responsive transcriptional regulator [candidate division Zixibacteria bacterium]
MLTIGKLAKAAGVDHQTVRYYERIGLLPEPNRTPSGYRVYDDTAVGRLKFIRQAKAVGFTLKDIRILLALTEGTGVRCAEVQQFIEDRLRQIREQIEHLQLLEAGLQDLLGQCRRSEVLNGCPVLESLLNENVTVTEE